MTRSLKGVSAPISHCWVAPEEVQNYDIRSDDPAQWSILMKPNSFRDFACLWSIYRLEHRYYPGVPFYYLPKLHKALRPFFVGNGMVP